MDDYRTAAMEVSCAFCLIKNQPIDKVSYGSIVEAYLQLTSLLRLKSQSGNTDIFLYI